VREVLEKCNADVSGLRVNEDCICFCYGRLDYEIDSTSVRYKVIGSEDWTSHTHKLFKRNWHYAKIDKAIAELIALLTPATPSAQSYSATARGIEELKEEHERVLEFANQRCDELRAKVTELENSVRDLNAENESMRNCFGSADEAGQAVGDLVHKLEKNVSKQADLKDEETELHISLMTAIAREQIAGNALEQS
jgi:hypothetical protein